MYTYCREKFTIYYHSMYGNIVLDNTERDHSLKIIKEKTLEINTTIEYLQNKVNMYIDLHGFRKDLMVEIDGFSVDNGSKIEKTFLNVVDLSIFLSNIELRKEIYNLEGMSSKELLTWWLKRRNIDKK